MEEEKLLKKKKTEVVEFDEFLNDEADQKIDNNQNYISQQTDDEEQDLIGDSAPSNTENTPSKPQPKRFTFYNRKIMPQSESIIADPVKLIDGGAEEDDQDEGGVLEAGGKTILHEKLITDLQNELDDETFNRILGEGEVHDFRQTSRMHIEEEKVADNSESHIDEKNICNKSEYDDTNERQNSILDDSSFGPMISHIEKGMTKM